MNIINLLVTSIPVLIASHLCLRRAGGITHLWRDRLMTFDEQEFFMELIPSMPRTCVFSQNIILSVYTSSRNTHYIT